MVAPEESVLAIGDVHGCADELRELLEIAAPSPNTTVVFLGDYIDRGSQSRQVVETILELKKTHRVVSLRGNHEAMLLEFLDGRDAQRVARFIMNGGSSTLASYASGPGRYEIPAEHMEFFHSTAIAFETATHFFVHAGVPEIPLAELDPVEREEELLWTRRRGDFPWEKVIVHGHTVVEEIEITSHQINLDTGCVYDRMLSAMEFPSCRVFSVPKRTETSPHLRLRDGSRRSSVRFMGAIPVHVDYNGQPLVFETLDYSDVGLALRTPRGAVVDAIPVGAVLSGQIGPAALFRIPFTGHVVRTSYDTRNVYLALAIDLSIGPTPEPPLPDSP